MNIADLQNIIAERIEIARDAKLSEEKKKEENTNSKVIVSLAKQFINASVFAMKVEKGIVNGELQANGVVGKLIQDEDVTVKKNLINKNRRNNKA